VPHRAELADPGFRRELNYWIGQGVFGSPPVRERLRHAANARPELAEHVARRDHAIVESAALLGIICAVGDSHLHHVRVGQLFERLWLTATAMGVSINPMSQTMRHPQLRAGVADLLPSAGWTPQHLFRVGFGSSAAGSARRGGRWTTWWSEAGSPREADAPNNPRRSAGGDRRSLCLHSKGPGFPGPSRLTRRCRRLFRSNTRCRNTPCCSRSWFLPWAPPGNRGTVPHTQYRAWGRRRGSWPFRRLQAAW
jgi:hypothetical protein